MKDVGGWCGEEMVTVVAVAASVTGIVWDGNANDNRGKSFRPVMYDADAVDCSGAW